MMNPNEELINRLYIIREFPLLMLSDVISFEVFCDNADNLFEMREQLVTERMVEKCYLKKK